MALVLDSDCKKLTVIVFQGSLAEGDKVTMEVARLLKDDYLQQNGYTPYDRYRVISGLKTNRATFEPLFLVC